MLICDYVRTNFCELEPSLRANPLPTYQVVCSIFLALGNQRESALWWNMGLCIFNVLCWQLNPAQMRCTGTTNESTYILCRLLVKMRYIFAPL